MGAAEPEVERDNGAGGMKENEEEKEKQKQNTSSVGGGPEGAVAEEEMEQATGDVEKGEMRYHEEAARNVTSFVDNQAQVPPTLIHPDYHVSMLQRLNPTNPLRIAINGPTRVTTASPAQSQRSVARSTPTPQQSIASLNSRGYTNKCSLVLFLLHMAVAIGLVCFLLFKGVQGFLQANSTVKIKEKRLLKYLLPQIEIVSLLSVTLAFAWQKAVRDCPVLMVHVILWSTFIMSLSTGILLLCFQKPATDGVGACFIAFAIGSGLYACWVSHRAKFCCKILVKSLEPVSKFPDINRPIYLMLVVGFLWMSLWILAVIGALNFYFPPLIIILLVLSLAWTTEVIRNIANITVSRVTALYYLRGMQSSTQFCFQRAVTLNLGSASLGSLLVPAIEALRIIARGLNLLEGEDEFMFSCAKCCLGVMTTIFRYGNGWAFVQIAVYGKGFVKASQDTWELFEMQEMEPIVDSDITSSICFLTGVCSGSICVIVVAAWTFTVHKDYTATLSLLAFFIGYLMTRISMALPHACVSCYYVCYAENPQNRYFDDTIRDRQSVIKSGRDAVVPTPRVPGGRYARR
ncbi:hypothetical protein SAY87_029281 [Trapa incisa]|uniref:Choline transporter-like protein n=1 Tax=Trapa incisa TaxID=236973 RepID=A0AAN7K7X4_9MYRT|nr:hypothetical protein SAY87_029281 [Trapa incisa]